MTEEDTEEIVGRDELTTTADYGTNQCRNTEETVPTASTCCPRPIKLTWRPVTVEPVMFLVMFSLALNVPLSTQYVWDRIGEDLGFNGSRSSGCSNESLSLDPVAKEVEILSVNWNLYITVGQYSVAMVLVPLLGSWSDLAGRRPVLIISNLGMAIQAVVNLLVLYLKLPVFYLLLARILSGLTGDFVAAMAICYSYVADVSDQRSRTFRVAILEACRAVSAMLASVLGGKWAQADGYIKPFWMVLVMNLATVFYVYLFVPETMVPIPGAKLFSLRHYRAVWQLLSSGGGAAAAAGRRTRTRLWLYLLSYLIVLVVHTGSFSLYVLYELSAPLCWSSSLIGYGLALLNLTSLIGLLALKVTQRCLEESWVALMGLVSNVAGLLVFSMANTTGLMFTGYALCFLYMTTSPVLTSKMSKLLGPLEQGALFATIACVSSLSHLVGYSLFNWLFAATLHLMKGFSFLFAVALLLIPSGIIGVLKCIDQRRERGAG
ncbi:proton-coupled folate transporter-like [Nelusetta ayraudi]|uniref:proton-coupled folate transporter-like n=1 Tax=Nelusetta ayraudi TaxID=303726 RepID=UPI003F72DA8F